jgi:predicted RNase H-like nuclease (RuvC/YqgF family)
MPNKLTDAEVKKALVQVMACNNNDIIGCNDCLMLKYYPKCDERILYFALDLINRYEGELEKNENIIRVADKTIATLNAENENLKAEVERVQIEHRAMRQTVHYFKLENDKLKEYNDNLLAANTDLSNCVLEAKAEAYKEAFEKLKEKKRTMLDYDEAGFSSKITVVSIEEIDNLLNELVGGIDG